MKIYNTLTKSKEEFQPINTGKVSFYHCGPTVYWVQHIGNLRSMVLADLIRRSLVYLGYEVRFVRNYTDVGHLTGDNIGDADTGEDRMEKASKRENLDPQDIAQKYIDIFEKDTQELNIIEPTAKPVASQYIQQMQDMIQVLIDKGFAYFTPKAVYFEVDKFEEYNKLNKQDLEKNIKGQGKGEVGDSDKKKPYDFALWFFKTGAHANALQYWESPFESELVKNGEGIPGWHIECSAMAGELLGKTIDIHMGGIEHIAIHHTNEIAQSEAANGQRFVDYWLHNEHLLIDGGKMSKSDGNVFTLENVIARGFNPLVLRYFYLGAHYRSKQNFTWEALQSAQDAFEKLVANVRELSIEKPGVVDKDYDEKFRNALENDFNIPEALAVMWEVIKSDIKESNKLATILKFDKVFGLRLSEINTLEITQELQELLDSREEARKRKDWNEADRIRSEIAQKYNLEVKDNSDGKSTV